jgi:hypothetical protein
MKAAYSSDLKASLALEDDERVRQILHTEQGRLSNAARPLPAAIAYLRQMAPIFAIPEGQLARLRRRVSFGAPRARPIEYRLAEEKRFFDSVTYGFYQTFLNVPVWQAGLAVTLGQNPLRVVSATDSSQQGVAARLPAAAAIRRYRRVFALAEAARSAGENPTLPFLQGLLGAAASSNGAAPSGQQGIHRGRFFLYRYDAGRRQPGTHPDPGAAGPGAAGSPDGEELHVTLPLPPVPHEIRDGGDYLVAELVFSWSVPRRGSLIWRALAEVETDAVLFLEAQIAAVNGWVFPYDPITATGDTSMTADQGDDVLNPLRKPVALSRLGPPAAGVQSLAGDYVQVVDDPLHPPRVAPPTEPAGRDFQFNVRSDDFSAVNAYYHADQVFARIAELGFPLADYFDGTAFPVRVDHRDTDDVQAACRANSGADGIGTVVFGLGLRLRGAGDTPIGRAVDRWVHWHEIGGHGILLDHVHSLNFRFAHSAGDGLAALQNDPESHLRATADRCKYAPFLGPPAEARRFDRTVRDGWAWGGANDFGPFGYSREQILATTHFRIYRALGGDASEAAGRWFASRTVTYLILRAVSTLTPATNPGEALLFCNALMAADLLRWTTEGLAGGAYNKVIRWAFEKQGLFQPAGAPTPIASEGDPPEVDVYVEDGRHGEYSYKADWWDNPSIWNRRAPDGGTAHQPPVPGVESYAYVKVKSRGKAAARNVLVQGYHGPPGAGLRWPRDFVPMKPLAGLTLSNLGPSHGEEATVGPFAWTPDSKFCGHDGLLMIASAEGDPSNVSRLAAGESLEEWRLVPHDNNVGLRRVQLVPADSAELRRALHGSIFVAGNPFSRPATMELRLHLPSVLTTYRWQLRFQGLPSLRFELQPGEKREIEIQLSGGRKFSREDVQLARDRDVILELLADGVLLGGVTYRLDPALG